MTTRFLLVRHATCALSESVLLGRTLDAALDERGARQAVALAQRIEREHPALVLTGPRRRTRETAHAIVRQIGCPMQIASELDEMEFGVWSGRAFAELARDPHWQRWNRERSDCRTPAGDSIVSVQARIVEYLHALALGFPGTTLVLVTHAEVIRGALLRVLCMPIDHYHRIEVSPASLSALHMTPAGLRVDVVNEPTVVEERLTA